MPPAFTAPRVNTGSGRVGSRVGPRARTTAPRRPLELDTVARRWQLAFDATDHALAATAGLLPDAEIQRKRHALTKERQETATMLGHLARLADVRPAPWLAPVPVTRQMLGLPPTIRACLFDLDGVLTNSGALLAGGLRARGVNAIGGARRYLEAAGFAGLPRGVVSASTLTLPMLELAGLATLVEERVDADVIHELRLRSRPAPDLLLAACSRLDARPRDTVTFTHSPAGIAAGHAAGLVVIGVGAAEQAELLRGFGAELVAPSLGSLLDRRLAS